LEYIVAVVILIVIKFLTKVKTLLQKDPIFGLSAKSALDIKTSCNSISGSLLTLQKTVCKVMPTHYQFLKYETD